MLKNSGPQVIGNLISCLSLLETKTSILYKTLADKIKLPFLRSLMLIIAHDTEKHSTTLKGVGESMNMKGVKLKDCEKKNRRFLASN